MRNGKRAVALLLIAVLGILPVRAAKAAETSGFLQEAYAFPYGATATVAA